MTVLRPYPAYKDSGIDWLGDLPEHWDTRAIKRAVREISDKGYPDLPLLAATQSMGVVRKDRYGQRTVLAMSNLESLKRVQIDDFVISLRSFQGGIERVYDEGILSSAYTVLRRDPKLLDVRYLARIFKSKPFLNELELNVTGIREGQNINYGSLRESHLPLPPLDEQRAIADFLDGMDARLTRFLAARRRMIALLEEQKQAVINQAVTRGLDPDVPLKDSGVDWLGEIPAHWEVRKISQCFNNMGSGTTPTSGDHRYYEAGTVPWVNTGDLNDGLLCEPNKRVTENALAAYSALKVYQPGALIIAMYGATVGRTGILEFAATVNQACFVLATSTVILPRLAQSQLIAFRPYLINFAVGGGQPNINSQIIRAFQIAVPPSDEQQAIVAHIDRETSRIEALIDRYRREIDLMQEYRTRLISDVVTGKLDVRGVELPPVEAVVGEEIEAAMQGDETGMAEALQT